MRIIYILLLFLCIHSNAQQKLLGFTDAGSEKQKGLEKQFDAQMNAGNLDTWMKFLSSHPHHVGSAKGRANAEYMADLFRQWGYQTEINTYYVLFPTPKTRLLELLGSKPYKAKLEEPSLSEDKTSGQKSEQLPSYNAYSADGDVTSELVFVNRGVPADYEELERMGIDVKGKIVIAKYGGSWRGIKPKVAAEHGAIGCIIYSDPADDGYVQGDTYPVGPFRRADAVQRGSVMDMPVYPGDPLTPGVGATKNAKRLDIKDVKTIMKIPVLPISYEDALPLLQSLGGPVAPAAWRGGLPITYHIGPGKDKVHLKLAFNWDQKPVHDVIAKMVGTDFPDQWIIRGNHHDAWVNGAADPLSGMVAELEEARALGELAKNGSKPRRTVVYCAWDGEEPALLGSTEWAEDHEKELKEKVVAYINSDGNGRGFIGASGSHTLEPFFNQVIEDVKDPQTGVSVKERRYAKQLVDADKASRAKLLGNKYMKLGALGAGSDYSPFIQHMGIASMDLGYGGEDPGGEYHSIFDSYDLYTRFKDPGFQYGVTLAKTAGRITMRLSNADALPFDFNAFYKTLNDYATEVKAMMDNQRVETETQNKMIEENLFAVGKDPKKTYASPEVKQAVPFLNFSELDNSLAQLKTSAEEFQKMYANATTLPVEKLNQLNLLLYKAERSLIDTDGLPRRPWYKHQVYAPGFYTGYGVKTLPGIREAIEQRNWKEAQDNIGIVSKVIEAYNAQVQQAAKVFSKPTF
ncbi:transferrin receptor-like dimerization domain-containing protein [Flavisolibacter ginsengisoli]|jgi:N-acetylated-alpha-linked acidic dipeptidase|uniref:N-acetylated-alpha-linked acidic dipeptidase n=1 Tax=Flavisolibacter ginsengisoli DSM 18119 TaxID=1121884 RepID=A0A1M4T7T2_9BACT|nr:transferrin receptor-like dimerization domain-containing protein [Flavisolibacter ginsengisoli]SHE40521.1 N-acetylated-alpha-linked acidic dipeptidase [Flavisolibacter ginsengisoli DSM 18119]